MSLNVPDKLIVKERSSVFMLWNSSAPHMEFYYILLEPLNILRPLVQIGLMDLNRVRKAAGSVIFLKKTSEVH